MADARLEPLTLLLGDTPLCVVAPDEAIYRLIRGAVVHRADLNSRPSGEARLSYGDNVLVAVVFRVERSLQG